MLRKARRCRSHREPTRKFLRSQPTLASTGTSWASSVRHAEWRARAMTIDSTRRRGVNTWLSGRLASEHQGWLGLSRSRNRERETRERVLFHDHLARHTGGNHAVREHAVDAR